jgi:hypothetical protein
MEVADGVNYFFSPQRRGGEAVLRIRRFDELALSVFIGVNLWLENWVNHRWTQINTDN